MAAAKPSASVPSNLVPIAFGGIISDRCLAAHNPTSVLSGPINPKGDHPHVRTFPLAFSTLGCPEWSFEYAAEQAAASGYVALEVRILDGQIVPADLPSQRRREIKTVLERTGVEIIALGLSTRFITRRKCTCRQPRRPKALYRASRRHGRAHGPHLWRQCRGRLVGRSGH